MRRNVKSCLELPDARMKPNTGMLFGCLSSQNSRCPACPNFVRLFILLFFDVLSQYQHQFMYLCAKLITSIILIVFIPKNKSCNHEIFNVRPNGAINSVFRVLRWATLATPYIDGLVWCFRASAA